VFVEQEKVAGEEGPTNPKVQSSMIRRKLREKNTYVVP
jgi:hypothetical protein